MSSDANVEPYRHSTLTASIELIVYSVSPKEVIVKQQLI